MPHHQTGRPSHLIAVVISSMLVIWGCSNSSLSTGPDGSVSLSIPTDHRSQALACVGVFAPLEPVNVQNGSCKKHTDCTEGNNGKCIAGFGLIASSYRCVYDQCATDQDCDPGKVCHCSASEPARCLLFGNCQIDADCGKEGYCSPASSLDCGGYHPQDSYYCHTPKDQCLDNRDCTEKQYCNFDVVDGRWECMAPNMTCAIGLMTQRCDKPKGA